jgi:hypothetical protein
LFTGFHVTLLSAVALIVITLYFLMGGTPLMKLKHDTSLDAQFIRNFFGAYCKISICVALLALVVNALVGRFGFAVGAAGITLLAVGFRLTLIPAMALVGAQIQASQVGAIQKFRRLHIASLLVIFTQLLVIGWSLTGISR